MARFGYYLSAVIMFASWPALAGATVRVRADVSNAPGLSLRFRNMAAMTDSIEKAAAYALSHAVPIFEFEPVDRSSTSQPPMLSMTPSRNGRDFSGTWFLLQGGLPQVDPVIDLTFREIHGEWPRVRVLLDIRLTGPDMAAPPLNGIIALETGTARPDLISEDLTRLDWLEVVLTETFSHWNGRLERFVSEIPIELPADAAVLGTSTIIHTKLHYDDQRWRLQRVGRSYASLLLKVRPSTVFLGCARGDLPAPARSGDDNAVSGPLTMAESVTSNEAPKCQIRPHLRLPRGLRLNRFYLLRYWGGL